MPDLHVLRVFTAQDGTGGNPLGVFLDGGSVPGPRRQSVAAELGFSETVFVDDPATAALRIFTPAVELPFAGHPLVGTAWVLSHERTAAEVLRPPAGEVPARVDRDRAFVAGRADWPPRYDWLELSSPAAVEALSGPPGGTDMEAAYAWIDERGGIVRARVFPIGLGIDEDEATGGAAVQLGGLLLRDLEIRQGEGSVIQVHPREDGWVEIGGRAVLDEVRSFEL
jgi:predicted PhzF superfamily epimerase YddE/YHI9